MMIYYFQIRYLMKAIKLLSKILENQTTTYEMHKLPLAQTWVPCKHEIRLSHNGDNNTIILG